MSMGQREIVSSWQELHLMYDLMNITRWVHEVQQLMENKVI